MKLLKVINPRSVPEYKFRQYSIREASRTISLDKDGKIGVVYIEKYDVYQIAGGGIEKNESREEA